MVSDCNTSRVQYTTSDISCLLLGMQQLHSIMGLAVRMVAGQRRWAMSAAAEEYWLMRTIDTIAQPKYSFVP